MNKICPYCGRVGKLGTSCEGCGYVLQESDKSVNAPSVQPQASPPLVSPIRPDTDKLTNRKSEPVSAGRPVNSILRKIVIIIGWIISAPIFLFGLIGAMTLPEAFKNSASYGFLAILMVYFILNTALLIFHITHFKPLKGNHGKYFKYSYIANVLLFLIVGFVFL